MSGTPIYLGIDGCTGGWICAVLSGGALTVLRYGSISHIITAHPDFTACLIDIPIGLPDRPGQVRPDDAARQALGARRATIFPVPCRQAVYAPTRSQAYSENERVLGKKFTPLTAGLIPKIREADEFLQANPHLKNRLLESHPELTFCQLANRLLLTSKKTPEGRAERIGLLQARGAAIDEALVLPLAKTLRCAPDDILDACCLAVSAVYVAQGNCKVLPEHPEHDDTGLLMQMIIPKIL